MLSNAILLLAFLLSTQVRDSMAFSVEEFPEERLYRPLSDSGMSPYSGKSLFKSNKVVLTFDDGPAPALTERVLDILKKYDVKATFFIVGRRINESTYPTIERAIREGHLIGAHSMNHDPSSNLLSEAAFTADTLGTFKKIQAVFDRYHLTQNEVYYRFPFGAYGRNKSYHHMNVLRDLGKKIYGDNCINFAFWSVDSSDWVKGMTANEVYQNIMASFDGGEMTVFEKVNGSYQKKKRKAYPEEITRGGVILFHDVHTPSVEALPMLLETFKKRSIQVVPMNTVKEYSFENKVCGLNPNKNF